MKNRRNGAREKRQDGACNGPVIQTRIKRVISADAPSQTSSNALICVRLMMGVHNRIVTMVMWISAAEPVVILPPLELGQGLIAEQSTYYGFGGCKSTIFYLVDSPDLSATVILSTHIVKPLKRT